MDESTLTIFIVGCGVFGVAIAATFLSLMASDHPNDAPDVHEAAKPAEQLIKTDESTADELAASAS